MDILKSYPLDTFKLERVIEQRLREWAGNIPGQYDESYPDRIPVKTNRFILVNPYGDKAPPNNNKFKEWRRFNNWKESLKTQWHNLLFVEGMEVKVDEDQGEPDEMNAILKEEIKTAIKITYKNISTTKIKNQYYWKI